jgi:dipeptidase
MCDTQLIRSGDVTFFAKNSDREPSEAQLVCYVPAVANDTTARLQATYIGIPQVAHRYAVILSKPAWMWGAEMGVNDQGVVIGNEAVFTRLVDKHGSALLGMDLVRLGLERGASARQALECITDLLETHGQGGPAGFRNKGFRYDSSFLLADSQEAWVLETAGRHWVARRIDSSAAISNALSIQCNYDLSSAGLVDFARREGLCKGSGRLNFARTFDTRFMRTVGCAHARRSLGEAHLAQLVQAGEASFSAMAENLRQHQQHHKGHRADEFARHSNRDICLHAGGLTRPSQTCGSMIVKLRSHSMPQIMVTGTSAPCLSLFQPVNFPLVDNPLPAFVLPQTAGEQDSLWWQFETVHRRALFDESFRAELLADRDRVEAHMFAAMENGQPDVAASEVAQRWHREWHEREHTRATTYPRYSTYGRYWQRLNQLDQRG